MESTLLGAGTGAAVGAGSAALLSDRDKGQAILTSALIGGAIGGVVGYFTDQGLENRDASVRRDTLLNLEKYGVSGFYGDDPKPGDANGQKIFLMTDGPK